MESIVAGKRKSRRSRRRARWIAEGLVLGVMTGHALADLGVRAVPFLRTLDIVLILAVVCPLIQLTRARNAVYFASVIAAVCYLIVGYTPVSPGLIRHRPRNDRLQPADAVVVLSSTMYDSGIIPAEQQQRLHHAYRILKERLAPRLVITRLPDPAPSPLQMVRDQLDFYGIGAPVIETDVVENTYEEAVSVRALMQREGWKKVILVSSILHMKRAAATFEKAGVPVIASPCRESTFDLRSLRPGRDRITAFRSWIWEEIGWYTYRWRGWV